MRSFGLCRHLVPGSRFLWHELSSQVDLSEFSEESSFQRDLANKNQLIRGLALRVMTSIPMRDILQIQVMAIRKASADVYAGATVLSPVLACS